MYSYKWRWPIAIGIGTLWLAIMVWVIILPNPQEYFSDFPWPIAIVWLLMWLFFVGIGYFFGFCFTRPKGYPDDYVKPEQLHKGHIYRAGDYFVQYLGTNDDGDHKFMRIVVVSPENVWRFLSERKLQSD
jgi:hypothetical protein